MTKDTTTTAGPDPETLKSIRSVAALVSDLVDGFLTSSGNAQVPPRGGGEPSVVTTSI